MTAIWMAVLIVTIVVSALIGVGIGAWQRSRHGPVTPTAAQRTGMANAGLRRSLLLVAAACVLVGALLLFVDQLLGGLIVVAGAIAGYASQRQTE